MIVATSSCSKETRRSLALRALRAGQGLQNLGGRKEQVLRLIAAGHTFNDVPALDGGPNPASAAAMEPSVVYVIRRAELRKLIVTRPEMAGAVVQTLASALRHLVALVEDLSLRHVTARVAKILLEQEASFQEGTARLSPDTAGDGSAGWHRTRSGRTSAQRARSCRCHRDAPGPCRGGEP